MSDTTPPSTQTIPKFTATIVLKDQADTTNGVDMAVTFDPPLKTEADFKLIHDKSPALFAAVNAMEAIRVLMTQDDDNFSHDDQSGPEGADGGCCDAGCCEGSDSVPIDTTDGQSA